ncbi:hypothetical protein IKG02_02550 [Candidatus Saccharibacteria bacterium]|nr:hypothetical protein [Candidatus Saccharibacteria bacterium]
MNISSVINFVMNLVFFLLCSATVLFIDVLFTDFTIKITKAVLEDYFVAHKPTPRSKKIHTFLRDNQYYLGIVFIIIMAIVGLLVVSKLFLLIIVRS